jgi:gas vesicle protein
MAKDDSAAATVITAFVLGAITGAAVALLVAPATGEELRRKLGEKAREGADAANEAARQGREFVNRQRENVTQAVERGREAYQQARGAGMPGSPMPGTPAPGAPGGAAAGAPSGEGL